MYLHSATYLNLVNAEFLVLAFFLVLSGWGSPLSCCCADTNTTYSMGTAALCCPFYCCWCRYYATDRAYADQIFGVGVGVMLPILLLLVPLLHYG